MFAVTVGNKLPLGGNGQRWESHQWGNSVERGKLMRSGS